MASVIDYVEHFVPVSGGIRLYCREYGRVGAASPVSVLCLPGLTRNCRDFEQLARWLAADFRVFTPDLRGRGRSDYDPNWRNYQPMTYVHDVGELLTLLRLPKVAIIGTSLGGLVAMTMAFLQPSRLAAVVLNDVGPELEQRGLARIADYVGRLPPVSSWKEATIQAKLVNGTALPDLTDEEWLQFARNTYKEKNDGTPILDMDPKIGDASREASGPLPDLWPLFRALAGIPTALIRGATSDILTSVTAAKMQHEKPDLKVTEVPDRGHAPTLNEPESRRAIRELLSLVHPKISGTGEKSS